ncbi:hypothetical protein [Candidatus Poriferisodalis sp.]|uniref:hypothetical protein n=1 Tax=Candidatus Poriferisodalis sp. TaxID=3101277 RepID=UPI003B01D940
MGEPTVPQAQPVEGRSFPTARGARPTFFDDGGATDAVLAMDLVAESVSAGFDDGSVEITAVPMGRVLRTGKKQQTGQLTLLVGQA